MCILFPCVQLQGVKKVDHKRSLSSVTQDQRSESPKEFVWGSLLALLMTPPWRASVITVTRRRSGLRIARLAIRVPSLAHAWRVQCAQGSTPTPTLSMDVSRQKPLDIIIAVCLWDISGPYGRPTSLCKYSSKWAIQASVSMFFVFFSLYILSFLMFCFFFSQFSAWRFVLPISTVCDV